MMRNKHGTGHAVTHRWPGVTGEWYPHEVHPFSTDLSIKNVNYFLVRRNPDGTRDALYNGQTGDTSTRFSFAAHEQFRAAYLLGANEIHIHHGGDEPSRLRIETDLRQQHRSPLNEQQIPVPVPRKSTTRLGQITA